MVVENKYRMNDDVPQLSSVYNDLRIIKCFLKIIIRT